ncbi:hypothetical protein Pcar_3207 [Syntrophotalea carbinolica DSM 2380]|uniref:Uncharacterized protein n=1 Tax=Syntrophotalea carbinolica (strain DSM 2380 / NBRC 103641 / GraBd1) TaxID=338963 RepID=Q0C6W0_SYNC1|nr:hypothetical protein Pcar_3207 [Syntrophotalea carbinolica DSM 2380]
MISLSQLSPYGDKSVDFPTVLTSLRFFPLFFDLPKKQSGLVMNKICIGLAGRIDAR